MAAGGLAVAGMANQASAATQQYYDANGTTAGYGITDGGSYSWDDPNWASASGGAAATSTWVTDGTGFARFFGAGTTGTNAASYTVTVNNDEKMAGLFVTANGVNVTINAAGAGTLDISSGVQGFLNGGGSSTLRINAPLSGSGGFEPENGGTIFLAGTNTYTGGTLLAQSGTLTYFNNGSAFGTGDITVTLTSGTSFAPLLGTGGHTITLPNNFKMAGPAGEGVNFAADANTPVVSSGNWNMGTSGVNLRNNGTNSSPLTLSGNISGTGNLVVSGAKGGTITFSGTNDTYTGTTTLGASAATAITLKLGAANALATTTGFTFAGGTLNPGGFNQAMTSAPATLSAASILDFGSLPSEVDFANSSAKTWSGTLNLVNFDPSIDKLRFGTDATGLTSGQLADILVNGSAANATLDPNGFVVTPEPGSMALLVGAPLLLARRRRRDRLTAS